MYEESSMTKDTLHYSQNTTYDVMKFYEIMYLNLMYKAVIAAYMAKIIIIIIYINIYRFIYLKKE